MEQLPTYVRSFGLSVEPYGVSNKSLCSPNNWLASFLKHFGGSLHKEARSLSSLDTNRFDPKTLNSNSYSSKSTSEVIR